MVFRGWRDRRFQRAAEVSTNGDLWTRIGHAIAPREHGADIVNLFHINSHLTWEEAQAKGFPHHAWLGNQHADRLAEQAAHDHDIDDNQMDLYDWANATAALVRRRIAAATVDATDRRPSDGRAIREARQEQRVGRDTDYATVQHWFQQGCQGPPLRHSTGIAQHGTAARDSHPMVFLRKEARWFCRLCGASTTEYISEKLQGGCLQRPGYNSIKYKLKHWLERAAEEAATTPQDATHSTSSPPDTLDTDERNNQHDDLRDDLRHDRPDVTDSSSENSQRARTTPPPTRTAVSTDPPGTSSPAVHRHEQQRLETTGQPNDKQQHHDQATNAESTCSTT
ncbi:unnamed protein product, partial [Prorocentrum cordatum]